MTKTFCDHCDSEILPSQRGKGRIEIAIDHQPAIVKDLCSECRSDLMTWINTRPISSI